MHKTGVNIYVICLVETGKEKVILAEVNNFEKFQPNISFESFCF